MDNCLLSVIVPCSNTKEYLGECLDSIIKATHGKGISAEILVIDDFSNDGSKEIADSYSSKYDFIKTISNDKETRGPGRARNIGIDMAVGKYISFIDSDDIVVEDMYERTIASLEYHGSDICVCDVSRVNNDKHVFCIAQNRGFSLLKSSITTLKEDPQLVFGILCTNSVVRSAVLNENNIRFPENTLYEDFVYCIRLANEVKTISIVRNVEYLWRVRGGKESSITQSREDTQNFLDRTEMNRTIASYAMQQIYDLSVRQALFEKILILYASTMLSEKVVMDEEELQNRVKIMGDFAREYIPDSTYSEIPVIFEQIWRDVLEGNVDKVRKDVLYQKKNYSNAPVINHNGCFEIVTNQTIIDEDDRNILRDYKYGIPTSILRQVIKDDNTLHLKGWLYFRRIPVSDVGMQKLRAFLLNDVTGERIPLPLNESQATQLMKESKPLFNYDDYTYYSYDYLGCGFEITLDLKDLLKRVEAGNYLLLLAYDNPLKSGERILRGMHKNAVSELSQVRAEAAGKELAITVDSRKTPQIAIKETSHNQRGVLRRLFHSIF